jgi:hypothetical protein
MYIDRNKLAEELILREHIQKIIRKSSIKMISEAFPEQYQEYLNESKLRDSIRQLIPRLLNEEMSDQEAEDMAISFVRETLLGVIKIVKQDQAKFTNPDVQDGFIKYCLLALQNDFEENHGEEGEEQAADQDPDLDMLQELEDNGDGIVDMRISPKDDPMFISDEEEEEEEVGIPEAPLDSKESKEKELYLTLTDEEKVGFRYARDNTWPKVTKQIKKIHKQVVPQAKVSKYYEEWLTKNCH